jgi:hypothetical protein
MLSALPSVFLDVKKQLVEEKGGGSWKMQSSHNAVEDIYIYSESTLRVNLF